MIKINQNSVLKMREPSELLIISSRARKAKAAIGKFSFKTTGWSKKKFMM